MKKGLVFLVVFLAMALLASGAFAHTPICNCFDNSDGTITCEGGYSDGSSAAGVNMSVMDMGGKVLVKGKMGKNSEFTFKKPDVPYTVIFDAGPGHVVKVESKEIK